MANQWFKFYGGEYLSDPKIERLSPLERSCWITILCMASMGEGGVIEFLTVESLLNRSGIQFDPYYPEEWERALSVLVKFEKLKMIKTTEEGQIIVLNWAKRQEHNLTVAERVAKHRAKKANVTTNVTNVTTEENRIEENTSETKVSQGEPIIAVDPNTPPLREKKDLSYRKVFELWGNYPMNWRKDKTQIESAKNLLAEKGLDAVAQAVAFALKYRKDRFIVKIYKPSDLDRNWAKLADYQPE